MNLQVAARKRRLVPNRQRIRQPSRAAFRLLLRQEEPRFVGAKELAVRGKPTLAQRDVARKFAELYQPERCAEFRGFEVVTEFRKDELGVVADAVEFDVKTRCDIFGIDEERRLTAPTAQQLGTIGEHLPAHAKHAAVARGVNHVRAVEARGADVRALARAPAAQGGAERVR